MRILITGASGSGTTTLGEALAREMALTHLDSDTYYWLSITPPFEIKRSSDARLSMLRADMEANSNLVLSGSIVGWGCEVENAFDLVVFLYLPTLKRIERLLQREHERYGAADPAFIQWAGLYDEGPPEGRSLASHLAWLGQRTCPILRLEEDQSVPERTHLVLQAIRDIPLAHRPTNA